MEHVETTRRSRPSMDDVATAAGVSKAAVSKVIRNAYGVSPSMRTKVETAIETLGYRPSIAARSMRGASFTIGFEIPQLGNDFFTQVLQGAADELEGSGFQLIVAPAMGKVNGAPVLNALVDRQVDGFVAVSPEVAPEWLERLGQEVPIVLLGRHDPSVNFDTVTNDDELGSRLVMQHLFDLGHTRIGHTTVGGSPKVPEHLLPHTIREQAYRSAMASRDLVATVASGGPLEPDGYHSARALLSSPERPTAIFAANDTLAIGAMRARMESGLTAADVSVVGYDDIDLAAHPLVSLTTIDQFGRESGRSAIRLLLERVQDGRKEARHTVFTPELRRRGSSQPAPTA